MILMMMMTKSLVADVIVTKIKKLEQTQRKRVGPNPGYLNPSKVQVIVELNSDV